MTSSSFDSTGAARRALEEIYRDYGLQGIDNEALLNQLLPDLLAGSPKETGLLKSAASTKTGEQLQTRINSGLAPAVAVRDVAALLGQSYALDPNACLWVVGEYSAALGHPVDLASLQATAPQSAPPIAPPPIVAPPPVAPQLPIPTPPVVAQPPQFDPTKVDPVPPPARGGQVFQPGRAALPLPPQPQPTPPTLMAGYDQTMADRAAHPANPPAYPGPAPMPMQHGQMPAQHGQMPAQHGPAPVQHGPMPPSMGYPVGPPPAKKSSAVPLVLGGIAVVLVLIVIGVVGVVIALKEDTTCIGDAESCVASSASPSPKFSDGPASPSARPSASRSAAGGETGVRTIDLLPNDLNYARDCKLFGDSTPDGLTGVIEQYNCVYSSSAKLAGANVNVFRFGSKRNLEASLTGFNTERDIDDLDKDCPPKGDSVGGTFKWSMTSKPSIGGTLECYISVGEKHFYVWTEDTNFVMYEVSTDKPFTELDDWWRHMKRDAEK